MIFLATKFAHGAFIIVIIIPGLIVLFRRIHRYYDTMGTALATSEVPPALEIGAPGLILVPVIDISRLTSVVLARAVELGGEVRALHVAFEGEPTDSLEARWQTWGPGVPLIVVPSPQRSVMPSSPTWLCRGRGASEHPGAHWRDRTSQAPPPPAADQRGAILATALRLILNALVATVPFRLE